MTRRILLPWRAARWIYVDDFDMLSLRYSFEYLGAEGLKYYRECEPVTHEKQKKKMRVRSTYIFVSY